MKTIQAKRRLGANGPELPSLGLGCMGMSDFYGPAEEGESIATIQTALERIALAVPAQQVGGARYGPAQMAMLDSER